MSLATELCAAHILELQPYQSARRIGGDGIMINANEAAASLVSDQSIHRYPDDKPKQLNARYATYAGVNDEECLTCRGADEAIELLIRTFCEPGVDRIAQYTPTYGMYAISAQTHNIKVVNLDYETLAFGDFNEIRTVADNVKLIFVCNPNNPTGELISREVIIKLLEASQGKALVVVDEAYSDFSPEHSVTDCISQFDNLVVLRTMSKAFALAGARIGYAIANTDIIELLKKVIAPYPIADPVADLGLEAISADGQNKVAQSIIETHAVREQFVNKIRGFANVLEVLPSSANFVLVRVDNSERVFENLIKKGVVARDQSKQPRLDNCLRFTIGDSAQMNATAQALNEA